MWKQVGLVLTVAAIGLGSGEAEARFGKRSTPPPSSSPGGGSPSRPGGGHWGGGPNYGYPRGYYYGGYGYYGYPWGSYYYFDPAWAWPFLGAGVPSYGRYYGYDLTWRRLRPPPPPPSVQDMSTPPAQLDLKVDTGAVANGYSVGLGLNVDGQRFGFGTRLDLFNLAAEQGMGRDSITLFSLGPSFLLVNNDRVKWRLSGGLDAAFAPDITMIGPGLGTSARLKVAGPIKLEAAAHWTPLPYVQLSGDAGVGVDLGSVLRLRAGYRATYLSDQGLVDGIVNRDLFAGPFVGLSLAP